MKEEYILIISLISIAVALLVINGLQKALLSQKDELIKLQSAEIKRAYRCTDVVLEYCLQDILKQSIQEGVEDYERAEDCRRLLEQLRKDKVK